MLLFKVGVLQEADLAACVNVVFNKYLELMRKLQEIYMLTPSFLNGQWGLDDYQMLAYVFGAY
jgi:serine/threonine-protein phosphatase 2A activator